MPTYPASPRSAFLLPCQGHTADFTANVAALIATTKVVPA